MAIENENTASTSSTSDGVKQLLSRIEALGIDPISDSNALIAEVTEQSGRALELAQQVSIRLDAIADRLAELSLALTNGMRAMGLALEQAQIATEADKQEQDQRITALVAAARNQTDEGGE